MFADPFVGCDFTSLKHLAQAFSQKTRRRSGGVIESGAINPISNDVFTDYPEAFMQH